MVKSILSFMIGTVLVMGLVSCGHRPSTSESISAPMEPTTAVITIEDPAECLSALKIANYNLVLAKQHAKGAHVFMDWSRADKALTAANEAYVTKDYPICRQKAEEVSSYVQRNENYIKWRHSLNL